MAVTEPASSCTRVGAKVPPAQASDEPPSATRAVITRAGVMPGILGASAAAAPKTVSPLRADTDRVHALVEARVRRLVGPDEVVALVLDGEVGAVDEQFGVPADLVCDRGVEVLLRGLVLLQAGDAALVLHYCALRTVVVRDASLESLALVPEDEIRRLGRVVLEWNLVPGQIPLSRVAGRVSEVELHAGIGEEPRQEREPLPIVELRAIDAVARSLNRFGDVDAMAAYHAVLVRQVADVGHGAVDDEALHVDVEQLEAHQTRRIDVVLEGSTVVRGAPRVEVRIARRSTLRNLKLRTRRGLHQRVIELQAAAPLA